jgi:hypothetical protein
MFGEKYDKAGCGSAGTEFVSPDEIFKVRIVSNESVCQNYSTFLYFLQHFFGGEDLAGTVIV